jgi:hypothetical protein
MRTDQKPVLKSSIIRRWLDLALIFLTYRGRYMHLYCDKGRVTVEFSYRPIEHISVLRRCRLHHLGLYGTKVTDWSVLRAIDFVELNVGGTTFSDTEVLRGKHLQRLEMWGTPVTSLEPIRGMPLQLLQVGATSIRDFSPIASLPLDVLLMLQCECDDITFLRGMNLSDFGFTFTPRTVGIDHLMAMSRLRMIATSVYDVFTPAEFYHRYTTGQPLDEKAREIANLQHTSGKGD